MSKRAAWVTVVIASIVAGALLLPFAKPLGRAAWVVSVLIVPSVIAVAVWKRTPDMLDRGFLLIPVAIVSSFVGAWFGLFFFCNAGGGLELCTK